MISRHAIVDMGSNSLRLVIFEVENGDPHSAKVIHNKKSMAGLAGYIQNDALSDEGIEKACTILQKHLASAEALGVPKENINVFATAILRNIKNSEQAKNLISMSTKIDIDILTGDDEARLGFIGCSNAIEGNKGLVIDIGGGSTEVTTWNTLDTLDTNKPLSKSMPFGSLYLYLSFVSDIMPTRGEMAKISEFVSDHLNKSEVFPKLPYSEAVGIGGSARSSIKLVRALINSDIADTVRIDDIRSLLKMPCINYQKTLHTILRICPDRVHTILPGTVALLQIMEHAGATTLKISKSGLREGYLIDKILR